MARTCSDDNPLSTRFLLLERQHMCQCQIAYVDPRAGFCELVFLWLGAWLKQEVIPFLDGGVERFGGFDILDWWLL